MGPRKKELGVGGKHFCFLFSFGPVDQKINDEDNLLCKKASFPDISPMFRVAAIIPVTCSRFAFRPDEKQDLRREGNGEGAMAAITDIQITSDGTGSLKHKFETNRMQNPNSMHTSL